MAMLYRPLALQRETCIFPPVALDKPLEIFEPFLADVITSGRPTSTPNLVEIGSRAAPLHSGEILRFCDFCSPFFPFPHLAYRSQLWTDSHVLWLKRRVLFRTRAFSGFEAFKVTFRGPPAPLTPSFWMDLTDLQRRSLLALEPSRVNYPWTSK